MTAKGKSGAKLLLVAVVTSTAVAGDFGLSWYTIDGGGEMFMSGAEYQLSGTTGQPDAGSVMTGDDFELIGGFWAGVGGCPEDLDGDGEVGLADLSVVLSAFGTCVGDSGFDPLADLDGNGCVELNDLSQLLAVFGSNCPTR